MGIGGGQRDGLDGCCTAHLNAQDFRLPRSKLDHTIAAFIGAESGTWQCHARRNFRLDRNHPAFPQKNHVEGCRGAMHPESGSGGFAEVEPHAPQWWQGGAHLQAPSELLGGCRGFQLNAIAGCRLSTEPGSSTAGIRGLQAPACRHRQVLGRRTGLCLPAIGCLPGKSTTHQHAQTTAHHQP